ncbi:hypothetical protein [Ralstonia solanacearum]|nr:hypothetical protein [Ralstonia solanacearum]QOK83500.1 hypothetical protein HF906_15890 [Ralstonia solanacearum]
MNNRKYRLVHQCIKLATAVCRLIEVLVSMASNYRYPYACPMVYAL